MKNKSLLKNILFSIIAVLLGVTVIGLCAGCFVKFSETAFGVTITETTPGFDIMFGKDGAEVAAVPLVAFIFTCIAIISVIASLFLKKKGSKLLKLFSALLFIVAGVLFFFSKMNCLVANGLDAATEGFHLGWAAIIAGIVSLIAGFIMICDVFKKSKK